MYSYNVLKLYVLYTYIYTLFLTSKSTYNYVYMQPDKTLKTKYNLMIPEMKIIYLPFFFKIQG